MYRWIWFCLLFSQIALAEPHWFQDLALQKRLDIKTASHAHSGNRLKLLINGAHSLKQRMANMSEADWILIKTFEFSDDETGKATLDLLTQKAAQGAKVFIQYDIKGVFYTTPNSSSDLKRGKISAIPPYLQKFVEESNGNGFLIPCSFPDSLLAAIGMDWVPKDHEKYCITGKWQGGITPLKAILGGMNIGDIYFLGGMRDPEGRFKTVSSYASEGFSGYQAFAMRDTDIEVVGTVTEDILARYIESAQLQLRNPNRIFQREIAPQIQNAVQELQKIQNILNKEAEKAYPKGVGDAFVRFVFKSSRQFGSKDALHIIRLFQIMLDRIPARSTAQFATGYFLPTKLLWKAIADAAHRGVDFDILSNLPKGPELTIAIVALAARSEMRYFLKSMPANSVHFYEWLGAPSEGIGSVSHQKVYSFGKGENEPFCIGTANLNAMSLYWDSEDLLLIQSPSVKRQIDAMFHKDFSPPHSKELTLTDLKELTFIQRIQSFCYNKFFRDFL